MLCTLFSRKHFISFIVPVFCASLIPILYNIALFNVYSFSDVENCPLCLGKSICSRFINDSFDLDWSHFWINLLNVGFKNLQREKTVVFGTFDGKQVVLKKVFNNFNISSSGSYFVSLKNSVTVNFKHIVEKLKSFLRTTEGFIFNKFNLCPSVDNFEILVTSSNIYSDDITNLYFNLQYMLKVNIEPFIQQVAKDWAVAPYLGSCGLVAVSEYCGDSLTSSAPKMNWSERALAATQLLQFAYNATFDNPNFAFYFTDMTGDNFALSSGRNVRLVDLENVIVVDKHAQGMSQDWNDKHQVYHDVNKNEFAFSVEEICSHQISDFNIYSICQGILSGRSNLIAGGLLYTPPHDMEVVRDLIEDCVSPKNGASRFEVAGSIMKVLNAR